eukprot:GFYU01006271.1.p1 GENE.GFYU01006271.1~~GFYU01006271.1.p1  ORF type:complete len:293 (+),score=48.11 GFYU01006271.1:115-879(+)
MDLDLEWVRETYWGVGCSFVFWWVMYWLSPIINPMFFSTYNKLDRSGRVGWDIRFVSTIHVLAIIPMSYNCTLQQELIDDKLRGTSDLYWTTASISCGYFLWDILICLSTWKENGGGLFAHAVSCTVVYGITLIPTFPYYGAVFLFFEASTPFLNLRWWLLTSGMKNTKLYIYNGLILIAVFFWARLWRGVPESIRFLTFVAEVQSKDMAHPAIVWTLGFINILLNSLNVFWLTVLVRGAVKTLMAPKASAKKD